jgi:predicted dehydrogenase
MKGIAMSDSVINLGLVGCGNIAGPYADDFRGYDHLRLKGVTDINLERARDLGDKHQCPVYPSLEALLDDPAIDLIVNLTVPRAHYAIIQQCLNAGKHVYSEKPLALISTEAQALVALAKQKNLRLGCSPFTAMGEAQQTAWKIVRSGQLGNVRVVYADVNWGRIETWHPAPESFYEVGVLWDVGVYPLTLLTTMFGPARRVWAQGKVILSDRMTKDGQPFHLTTPDFVVAMIELAGGPLIRLTANFYVSNASTRQTGIELHGDKRSLSLASWVTSNSTVEIADFGSDFQTVPLVKAPPDNFRWGRGVAEMAEAMLTGRPHRTAGEQAAHIVEILEATDRSMRTQAAVDIASMFWSPAPMPWAEEAD